MTQAMSYLCRSDGGNMELYIQIEIEKSKNGFIRVIDKSSWDNKTIIAFYSTDKDNLDLTNADAEFIGKGIEFYLKKDVPSLQT